MDGNSHSSNAIRWDKVLVYWDYWQHIISAYWFISNVFAAGETHMRQTLKCIWLEKVFELWRIDKKWIKKNPKQTNFFEANSG